MADEERFLITARHGGRVSIMLKQTKRIVSLILALFIILTLGFNVLAFESYETTTYQYDGTKIVTPHAYVVKEVLDASDLQVESLKEPHDLFVDHNQNVYVVDTGNNQILCYNRNFQLLKTVNAFVSEKGEDSLFSPKGICVTSMGDLYIADTGNNRIVQFDADGNFVRCLYKPNTKFLGDGFVFSPTAISVDDYGRIFIVAANVINGLIELDEETGEFNSFFGAKKVTYNLLDYAWRRFMTKEQIERTASFVPTEYNNVVVDSDGFVYVTSGAYDSEKLLSEIKSKSLSGNVSSIRKLNQKGNDILVRKGYFAPVGNLPINESNAEEKLSTFNDVALSDSDIYSILDSKSNRIFTYSADGDLLYEFSGYGNQKGCSQIPVSIAYKGTDILLLDAYYGNITVFERTEYGDLISQALFLYQDSNYTEAVECWNKILKENSNFDIAYKGIGQSYLNDENYLDAMRYFQYCNNTKLYSRALQGYRSEIVNKYLLFIVLIIVMVILGIYKLFRLISKRNYGERYKDKRHTFTNQILYAIHIIFHPFDGFWDAKFERRASLKAANLILATAIIVMILQKLMTAYLFNNNYLEPINWFSEMISITGPVFLFVVSNWCFTTLLDGSGSFKDIYVSTAYSLTPLILLRLPMIPLSYVLILNEGAYINFFNTLSLIWVVLLIFCGSLVIHQFSLTKNVVISGLSIVGMCLIIFVMLLLLTTGQYIVSFMKTIILELTC